MRSTFFGLNTLLRALQAQQQALDTTNHNIANAGTDGYSRQRVSPATTNPYTPPAGNHPTPTAPPRALPTAGPAGSSRQRVSLTTTTPYTAPAGNKPTATALQLGSGVMVAE